ncbi:MAG: FAD-dependent oxidoreductase [Verrucomicrobia bacterium]|nr:FAD-dependent oxidoreductase [Verrucomicrobiota bacterium]
MKPIAILGGGLAGLSVGYFAARRGIPFRVYEAGAEVGGNCRTFRHGDFLFDSGAHRLHDKDAAVTGAVRGLLGGELLPCKVPSVIHRNGRLIDFPLSPLNLLRRLGPRTLLRATGEVLARRGRGRVPAGDLEAAAVRAYGPTLAGLFLLNYSRKLWGLDCRQLSPNATGNRLQGLSLATFLTEAFRGRQTKTRHLDGEFLYPRLGIGTIAVRLREVCGPATIRLRARVTRILHDGRRIRALEINGHERVETEHVVSTLPLNVWLRRMDPPPPDAILALAGQMRFRRLILVALFFSVPRITPFGTVYFPGPEVPFTRVSEPKNRSAHMAPDNQTSLVAEIPCHEDDAIWGMEEADVICRVRSHLQPLGWFQDEAFIGGRVLRLDHAYPVLAKGIEAKVGQVHAYLRGFENLAQCGRNATFLHASMHDVIRQGQAVVASFPAGAC